MRNTEDGRRGFWGFFNRKLNPNDSSLAVSINYVGHTIFTTGDMAEVAWGKFDRDIVCQGYKLSHHGSPNAMPSEKLSIKRLDHNRNATFAIATEGPKEDWQEELMPTDEVINNLNSRYNDNSSSPPEDHIGEVYSILNDRKDAEENDLIRPISYIFAIIPPPKSTEMGRFNFVRYFSITQEQAIVNRLNPQEGRDYYTEDINHPIERV